MIALRRLRGEDLELVSRKHSVTAALISRWRDDFLSRGESVVKRPGKLEEVTMESELLREEIERLEQNRFLSRRRSRKRAGPSRPSKGKPYGLARVC